MYRNYINKEQKLCRNKRHDNTYFILVIYAAYYAFKQQQFTQIQFDCVGFLTFRHVCLHIFLSDNNTAYAQEGLQILNPDQNITTNANTLSLTGSGTTIVKPDNVTVSLGLETTNKTANAALAANSKTMNKLIDVLKEAGIKNNETSTSSFSISPNYKYSQSSVISGRRIVGFTVSDSIQIQSTYINNTSKWIDTAIK